MSELDQSKVQITDPLVPTGQHTFVIEDLKDPRDEISSEEPQQDIEERAKHLLEFLRSESTKLGLVEYKIEESVEINELNSPEWKIDELEDYNSEEEKPRVQLKKH